MLVSMREGVHGHGTGKTGDAGNSWHAHQGGDAGHIGGGAAGLTHTFLHVSLQHISSLKLSTTQLTGIGSCDAALVSLMSDQRGLVQIRPPAAGAGVLVGGGVLGPAGQGPA